MNGGSLRRQADQCERSFQILSWIIEERTGFWPGHWLPIRIAEGRDRQAVVADIVSQIDRIAAELAKDPLSPDPVFHPRLRAGQTSPCREYSYAPQLQSPREHAQPRNG